MYVYSFDKLWGGVNEIDTLNLWQTFKRQNLLWPFKRIHNIDSWKPENISSIEEKLSFNKIRYINNFSTICYTNMIRNWNILELSKYRTNKQKSIAKKQKKLNFV